MIRVCSARLNWRFDAGIRPDRNQKVDQETELGVVLTAREVPDGSIVTKLTGTTRYVIRHTLRLFQNQDPQSRKPPVQIDGTFLVNDRGDISQVSDDSKLIWYAEAQQIMDWLSEQLDPELDQ